MKRNSFLLVMFVGSLFIEQLQATEKTPAAVIDLVPQNVSQMVTAILSECLRSELFKTIQYDVINRENMESILKEQAFQISGACDDMECIIRVGKILAVRKMFTGTLGKLGEKYILTLKIIDVETAKIDNIRTAERICSEGELPNLLRNTLYTLLGRPEKKWVAQKPPIELAEKLSLGINWPGVAIKYGISNVVALEARAQFGEGATAFGPRLHINFFRTYAFVGFTGLELDYILFNSEMTSGDGFAIYGLIGCEIFAIRSISFLVDIGPAYVTLGDEDYSVGNIHFVANLGLNFYFSKESLKEFFKGY